MHQLKIISSEDSKGNYLITVTQTALRELKISIPISRIEDLQEIETFGSIQKPVLIFNDKILVQGRVPSVTELKEILKKEII